MDTIMKDKKSKNKYVRYYKEYYTDVVDYSIEVHQKFALHNTFMFLLYGLGLVAIEVELQKFVCGICFTMSAISLIMFFLMKYHFTKYKKNAIVFSNAYLIVFLVLLTLLYFYHPSHTAYTLLICTIITTAMTNMMPLQYVPIILSVSVFDLVLYFTQKPLGDVIEIVGYVLNDFIVVFVIGINVLYSDMKFREFKQKNFLQNESYHDPLTKIYNRRYMERYVEMNLEVSDSCAMFLIDVDNFKAANDELGHETGDDLLCKISDILRSNFRKTDCVARIGGDEFVVLMPHVTDRAHVVNKVKTILKEFPIVLRGENQDKKVAITLSIGIIFTKSGEVIEYEDLYRRADSFMYKAKKNGKGRAVMEMKGGREQVISV